MATITSPLSIRPRQTTTPIAPGAPPAPMAPESLPGGNVALPTQASAAAGTMAQQPRYEERPQGQPSAGMAPINVDWNMVRQSSMPAQGGPAGTSNEAPARYSFPTQGGMSAERSSFPTYGQNISMGAQLAPQGQPGALQAAQMPQGLQPINPQYAGGADKIRSLLGPLGDLIAGKGAYAIQRGDIPLIEAGLNYQNQQLSEQDRQQGIAQLLQARQRVGQDPNSSAAREALWSTWQTGGEYTPQYLERQQGALGSQAALGLQAAQQSAAEDFGRRGLGGSLSGYQQAQLGQQAATSLGSQKAGMEQQYTAARESAKQQALQQYQAQAMQEEQQRQAYQEAIANAFLNTQRGAIDLSGLVNPPAYSGTAIR